MLDLLSNIIRQTRHIRAVLPCSNRVEKSEFFIGECYVDLLGRWRIKSVQRPVALQPRDLQDPEGRLQSGLIQALSFQRNIAAVHSGNHTESLKKCHGRVGATAIGSISHESSEGSLTELLLYEGSDDLIET